MRVIRLAMHGKDLDRPKTGPAQKTIQFHLGESQPDIRVKFASLFKGVPLQVEDHQPAARFQNLVGGGYRFGRMQGVMEALA